MLPLAIAFVKMRNHFGIALAEENHEYQYNLCPRRHASMHARHIQKVSFISGPTELQDSGTPSTFAMQQQIRPPFRVQTGCKRDALKLRVCLQFPQLLLHSLFTSTTDTQAKICLSSHRFSVAGHYVNRVFITLSTYMLLTGIMALLRSLLYSVFLLPFSSS